MTIIISLLCCAIILYIGVLIYRHDGSEFAKQTGYKLNGTLFDQQVQFQKKIFDIALSDKSSRLLLDVTVEDVTNKYVAEAILIHPSGIFVIDYVSKKGWISGTEKSYEWIEQLYRDKSTSFLNPIHENLRVIYTLQDLNDTLPKDAFESVIVFSDDCSFQNIEIDSPVVEVLKVKDLPAWGNKIAGNTLSDAEIETIYSTLKPYAKKTVAI